MIVAKTSWCDIKFWKNFRVKLTRRLTNRTLKLWTTGRQWHQIPLKSHKPWWRGWGGGEVTGRSARSVGRVITEYSPRFALVCLNLTSLILSPNYSCHLSSICHLIHSSTLVLYFHALSSNNFPFSSTPFSRALGFSICLHFHTFFWCQNP